MKSVQVAVYLVNFLRLFVEVAEQAERFCETLHRDHAVRHEIFFVIYSLSLDGYATLDKFYSHVGYWLVILKQ